MDARHWNESRHELIEQAGTVFRGPLATLSVRGR